MAITEPRTLAGFMELLPEDQILFNKLKNKIKHNFELYGYSPLDTPIIEDADILLAKTGGETNRQIYKFKKGDTDLALRFDLTVPLAKYVSLYNYELTFPFKRYQIGKVYRGEKPQKGRFREFYQCDIDVIDKDELSLYADAEIVATINSTFKDLDIGEILIRINNRKILIGLMEYLNLKDKSTKVLRIIDKIQKIGHEEAKTSLKKLGVDENHISKLIDFISIKGTPDDVVNKLKELDIENDIFQTGIQELEIVKENINQLQVPAEAWTYDLSLARGLDYYTGTVYETILKEHPDIGSVCGGGRFDNLASYFSDQKLPGVGVSIGLTRLFYKLKEAEILKSNKTSTTQVLIIPVEDSEYDKVFNVSSQLRDSGVSTQVYLGTKDSLGDKLDYANSIGVEWAVIIGEREKKESKVTLKSMVTGEQLLLPENELTQKLLELSEE